MMKAIIYLAGLSILLGACGPQHKLSKRQRYMQNTYETIKLAVNEAEVHILRDTVKVLFPEHLLFQVNSATIHTDNYPLMERFASALNKYDRTSILISGHTDPTGGAELNKQLSQQRADNARHVLEQYQVNSGRMYTWGMGSTQPVTDNNTLENRRKNRRVEFIILYSYEP